MPEGTIKQAARTIYKPGKFVVFEGTLRTFATLEDKAHEVGGEVPRVCRQTPANIACINRRGLVDGEKNNARQVARGDRRTAQQFPFYGELPGRMNLVADGADNGQFPQALVDGHGHRKRIFIRHRTIGALILPRQTKRKEVGPFLRFGRDRNQLPSESDNGLNIAQP